MEVKEMKKKKKNRKERKKKMGEKEKTVTNSPGKRSITESRTDVLMEHVKATNNNGRFRLKRSSGRRNSRA